MFEFFLSENKFTTICTANYTEILMAPSCT